MRLSPRAIIVKNALESQRRVLTQTIARIGKPYDRKAELVLASLKGELAETTVMLQEIMVNGTLMYIKEKNS
jgi:hypothetical protein